MGNANDILRGLFNAVETRIKKEALRQIRDEQDNPPIPPEDNNDDYR